MSRNLGESQVHEHGLGVDVVEHQGPLAEREGVAAPREVHLAAEDALRRALETTHIIAFWLWSYRVFIIFIIFFKLRGDKAKNQNSQQARGQEEFTSSTAMRSNLVAISRSSFVRATEYA